MKKGEDLKGKRMRLRYEVRTRAGTVFPKGSIVRIDGIERGRASMSMKNPNPLNVFGPKRIFCTNVELYYFEPPDAAEETDE